MTAIPLLSIQGLSRSYGSRRGIDQVSLTLVAGEIVGLVGSNGAGKTTLLECVLGLRQPDAGTLHWGTQAQVEGGRPCGAQLQGEALPPLLTVREVLALHGAFWPACHPTEELVERAQLRAILGARTETLSAGQRQRVALALAFQPRVPLVVLDEPSTALDRTARDSLYAWIRDRASGGTSFLIASHDPWEAALLFDRFLFLNNGRIADLDTSSGGESGALLRLQTSPQLAETVIRAWPGVRAVRPDGQGWALQTETPLATLRALVDDVAASGVVCQSLTWTLNESGREEPR